MQPLPRDFLTQIARKYDLSPEQEEAFVELFSSGRTQKTVADEVVHISHNAFRTRMTGVYRKFSFSDKAPNKSRKLHDFLLKKYRKWTPDRTLEDDADTDTLVQKVRNAVKEDIQNRCGEMRVLDMTQPVGLGDIYTHVNILERILGRRRKGLTEMFQGCSVENFDRFGLGGIEEKRVPGLKAVKKYPKLMILGKPGAGKTTFLKYIAIRCNGGDFYSDRVPIFVTLKDFAEAKRQPSLLAYICQQNSQQIADSLWEVIKLGQGLILLDGLDEVREEDSQRILREIRDCSQRFQRNRFILSCRIAAREYTFEQFVEVEVADFDWEQITTFAGNWFQRKVVKPEDFLQRLEENEPIRELATNPLLLTLLCLAFEESGDFPANRSELYKEGLDALLKKWDAKRGIQRDKVYKKLSVQRKEDLLSKIALTTFAGGDYFFKQQVAERYITDYIRNLPGASADEEALQLDSEVVLRAIEAQHGLLVARAKGIYSFSHLPFHEYFAAREVVICQQSGEKALRNFVRHLTEKRWREVFLLAVGMSPNADRLLQLMKQQVDGLVAEDEKIQQFLGWLQEKAESVDATYTPEVIDFAHEQGFFNLYNPVVFSRSLYISLSRANFFSLDLFLDCSLERLLKVYHTFDVNPSYFFDLDFDLEIARNLELILGNFQLRRLNPELYIVLEELRDCFPNREDEEFKTLWQKNSKTWTEDLRGAMIQYRNIGHDWQFSKEQKESLEQYYKVNKLLSQCLYSDCYASREMREEIEATMFLPYRKVGEAVELLES